MPRTKLSTHALAITIALGSLVGDEAGAQSLATNTITRYQLDNGLDVVLEERHETPRVAVQVEYRVGTRDQVDGYSGLAHLTEHLMFSWARGHRRGGLAFIESLGASDFNGITTADSTRYYEVVSASALERTLAFESDRMGFLLDHVDERALDSARRVVLRESSERRGASGASDFGPQILGSLHGRGHPYRFLHEDPEQVATLTLANAQWFHQRWYTPSNATLVLVGDFDASRARALIQRYFGGLARVARPARTPAPPIVTLSGPVQFTSSTNATSDSISSVFVTPPLFAADDAELDLISDALTEASTARLPRRFAPMPALAASADSEQRSREFVSMFYLGARGRAGSLDTLATITEGVLDELRRTELSQAELDALCARRLLWMRASHQTLEGRAYWLGLYARNASSIDAMLARDFDRYTAVTPRSLRRAARRWLAPNKRMIIVRRGARPANDSEIILEDDR
ncbi:MAG: insulinase family protein [Myxococcales bacterium]|nr:insulinase family protein [Myxococcales bacterium]